MNTPRIVIGLWTIALLVAASADDHIAETGAAVAEKRTQYGPVSAVVRLEPETVRIGDAVTLTIVVTADAGVEVLMPQFGTSLERFTILEFVPRQSIDDTGRSVSSQRYRLQTLVSGQQTIPPIAVEFVDRRPGQRSAPQDEDAFELLTQRVEFTVESVLPSSAALDLKPPLGPLESATAQSAPHWPWLWMGIGALLAIIALALFLRHLRGRARQASADEIALGRLQALEARPRPDAEAMDGFFVELSDLVRHYLEDRFALHAPELTTEEFLDQAAGSPDLTLSHRSFLQSFLRSADQVKFARHVPSTSDVETVLSTVREFLNQTAVLGTQGGSHRAPVSGGIARA